MLCDDLNGREIPKRGVIGICTADPLCCTVDTNIVKQYIPIKLIKKNKVSTEEKIEPRTTQR